MDIISNVRASQTHFKNVVLTIGSFDGVHVGHRCILKDVVEAAHALNGTPAVLTMRPHPREYFSPNNAPNLITSEHKKLQLLEDCGIEVVFFFEFNAETASIEAEDFVRGILRDRCHANTVIVGHDCRFGKGARGDFSLLEKIGAECDIRVKEVAPVMVEAERVSSTLVRERILQGDLASLNRLLGRPYSVSGEVQSGRGIGATLGFPTANVKPHHSAIPAQGVYIAEVIADGVSYPSAVNIGIAPTIRQEDLTIEAHLLDFSGDLVGQEIEIVFHERIRPEKKFSGKQELMEQIARDVKATREYFNL